jgi:hypothetical protein
MSPLIAGRASSSAPRPDSRTDSNGHALTDTRLHDLHVSPLLTGLLGAAGDDSEAAENRKVGGSTPPLATSPQVSDLGSCRSRPSAGHSICFGLLTSCSQGSDLPTGADSS